MIEGAVPHTILATPEGRLGLPIGGKVTDAVQVALIQDMWIMVVSQNRDDQAKVDLHCTGVSVQDCIEFKLDGRLSVS